MEKLRMCVNRVSRHPEWKRWVSDASCKAIAVVLLPALCLPALCLPLSAMPSIERHSPQSSSVDSVASLTAESYIVDSESAPAAEKSVGENAPTLSVSALRDKVGEHAPTLSVHTLGKNIGENATVETAPTSSTVNENSAVEGSAVENCAVEDSVYFANRNYRALDMHLPCYLTTGLPLDKKPDAQTCDVKYQVSLKLNLFRNMGGKHWDLFVSYSQVSVWSLYARSSPFYDNIYAPGISAYHPVIKGNRLIGEMQIGIEHQSNGKDDETSRSFNYAYFTYAQHLGNFTVQAKIRAGFGYIEDDIRDMHRYYGFGHIAGTYCTSNGLFAAGVVVNPCDYFRKCNVTAEAFLRLGRNLHAPYFFVQYYYGLEMPRQFMPDSWAPVSMLRFGIAIRPDKSNLY